jgi:O-Antigen ligase
MVLLFVAWARALSQREEREPAEYAVRAMKVAILVALAGIGFEELYGLYKGGDLRNSFWQIRPLIELPVTTVLFLSAFRWPRDRALLMGTLVVSALAKTGVGVYFYFVIMSDRPRDNLAFVTSHSDSMLYIMTVVAVGIPVLQQRSARAMRLALVVLPLMVLVLVLNNRRLAWVELAIAVVVMYFLHPRDRAWRFITRAIVCSIPIGVLYLAVGWNSSSSIFKPVQMVHSVVSGEKDRSTETRNIENYNLTQTLKPNLLTGTGFGHEYLEYVQADNISMFFPQFRYLPHNSLLGLWAFTGVLGVSSYWMLMIFGVALAGWTYRRARDPDDRAGAVAMLAASICFMIQAWGDMGLISAECVFLMGASLAVTARLAAKVARERLEASPPLALVEPLQATG